MRLDLIDYVFWCAPPVVMIAIAACMLRGRLQRDFPFFFNFVVFEIAAFAIEFPLRNRTNFYYVYWVVSALGVIVSFAVVVELVQKVVDGTRTLGHWNIRLFCWCALAAMAVIAMWPLTSSIDNVTNEVVLVERTVRMAQIALAFFMVMFGAPVGISKRDLVFGIAVGFGFFALVNFLVMASFKHQPTLSRTTLSRLDSAAYLVCILMWLAYVAVAAKADSSRQLPSAA